MANVHCFSLLILIFTINSFSVCADEDRKLHIVYMGSLPKGKYSPSSHHLTLLQRVIKTSSAQHLLITSYKRSFNGFAAMLSDYEAKQLQSSKEVVSVFPSITYQLQTTRSWSFMGFEETEHQHPSAKSNVIIGVLDTGIWPESQSFNDQGFFTPPMKWQGVCKGGPNFTCNDKLIGARYYGSRSNTARDYLGHGTHTASTAAGNKVKGASFFGLANGTARGGVPSARIAAYQVCDFMGCGGADILAGFDDAISDGVDVLTISLGSRTPHPFHTDVIAIGAFHAMERGIITSHSAGNSGPSLASLSSTAPWTLSVGASSIDRRIITKVILGNGMTLVGNSVNSFDLKGKNFPLINGIDAKLATCSDSQASSCSRSCLNESRVKGKIVVCDDEAGADGATRAGAVGSIFERKRTQEDVSYPWPLPAVVLNAESFGSLQSYMKSSKHPVAKILKSEEIKDSTAPLVASFSSRGPNRIAQDLLKPDIVAPGIDILAAFPLSPPTGSYYEKRKVKYNILSGTSMACPHAAGVAAYVQTFHPEWSPSAIQSAIMTTALPMNSTMNSGAEFAYGSGHINPSGAINPGLVYEAEKADYITFLCSLGYGGDRLRLISGDNSINCPEGANESPRNLNYPSMTAKIQSSMSFTVSFTRTVTNVGKSNSSYKAEISTNSKLKICVVPNVLSFKSKDEKKSFNVTVSGGSLNEDEMVSASLVWSDGSLNVRSTIVIYAE
ncbi:subtilisin-like protease SBT4.4 [Euphorbia lathyris]|uniref:subtilisin-like protease SBT4.4 n=1 Tax=Euphorbia lathyris TaxID=212925 RepID=UPI0033130A70